MLPRLTAPSGEPEPSEKEAALALHFDPAGRWGRVPVADPDTSVGEVRLALVGQRFESASHIAGCRDRRLVGLARIEDVLAADALTPLADILDLDPPVISGGEDEEVAAWKAVRHGESALAVVQDGLFVAVIPPRRMVEVLLEEHDEDMARLGGYLASTSSARHATEEPVATRLGHRLPWLIVGLAGAVAAAGVVGMFDHQLDEVALLALFVPGIVYMADAVGTQTEALVIRGLSVGVPVRRIVRRELATGLLVGLILAGLFLPVGVALWGDVGVIVTVSVSLLAACSTATLVAMTLPWALNRLGHDPAFGSGPLATVIQDLLSLVTYFAIASALL